MAKTCHANATQGIGRCATPKPIEIGKVSGRRSTKAPAWLWEFWNSKYHTMNRRISVAVPKGTFWALKTILFHLQLNKHGSWNLGSNSFAKEKKHTMQVKRKNPLIVLEYLCSFDFRSPFAVDRLSQLVSWKCDVTELQKGRHILQRSSWDWK